MTDYEKGFLNGLNANIKSLKPQEGEIIFLGLPCEYLNYDMAKASYDALRNLFPETPVIVSVGSINILGGAND